MKWTNKAAVYLSEIFRAESDRRIADSVSIRNLRSIHTFSLLVCVVDGLSLILFTAMNWGSAGFWRTFLNVGGCIAVCTLVAVLTARLIRQYKMDGTVSTERTNVLVSFFYAILSAWSILVDYQHYADGDQMLTFYIVQFCFLCFVVMKPKPGAVLITLSFSALYLCLFLLDGASGMQPQNYVIFLIIAVFGNAVRYTLQRETEKSKLDIIELNGILKREASIDDLTKLKNRKALRVDFERNIGKPVYVLMADVDHFKSYNDTYGHVTGDKVLREVALTFQEAFHDGDTYRYGGDEFLAVFSDHTDEEFFERIKHWKDAVCSIYIEETACPITCSFGYEKRLMETADDLRQTIMAADQKLYKEKKKHYDESLCRNPGKQTSGFDPEHAGHFFCMPSYRKNGTRLPFVKDNRKSDT